MGNLLAILCVAGFFVGVAVLGVFASMRSSQISQEEEEREI